MFQPFNDTKYLLFDYYASSLSHLVYAIVNRNVTLISESIFKGREQQKLDKKHWLSMIQLIQLYSLQFTKSTSIIELEGEQFHSSPNLLWYLHHHDHDG